MSAKNTISCPVPVGPVPGTQPFSPLGWSVWQRLAVAAVACALLWAVTLWALD